MRRIVVIWLLALAVAAPATAAAERGVKGTYALGGGVVITWHGAAGRCEAAGVCDVHGTLSYAPRDRGSFTLFPRDTSESTNSRSHAAIVRVRRDSSGETCVDVAGGGGGGPDFGSASSGGSSTLTLTVGGSFDEGSLSAGRCAGPLASDLMPVLPTARLSRS